MARIYFDIGRRYLLQGQVYVVRQKLLQGKLLVENQSFGGLITTSYEELCAAWGRNDLQFEVNDGPHVRRRPEEALATGYTLADFQHLPPHHRQEAWRRYELIRPFLDRPLKERSRAALESYVAKLRCTSAESTNEERVLDETRKKRTLRSAVGSALSRGSLERWIKAFVNSDYDIRSLVPATLRQGGKGQTRLDPDLEQIVSTVLADCAAAPAHRTGQEVYSMVVNRVATANRQREPTEQLAPPHPATLYRRIHAAGSTSILQRQASRVEAQAEQPVSPGPRPTRILERVEIDSTTLDLFLVDEEDRLPIGRPTLTYALDKSSGFPFGIYLGFEASSYHTVQSCLSHGILPKSDCMSVYETKHPWPVYGLPETLVVDNGKEFVGNALKDACGQLGIILEQMPVRTPWFKGSIERHFRSLNTGLVHMLPGTTFSNMLERGDYDAARHACLSLNAFWQILHIFLLDIYAQRYHEGVGGIPAKLWDACLQSGVTPCLHSNAQEVRLLLYPGDTRTLQRSGIDFENLRYQSPDLAGLRTKWGKGALVHIKYDPTDVSKIYILDPTEQGEWIPVPCVDQDYARNLSLWKHRKICSYLNQQKKTIDIYALAEAKQHIQEIVSKEFQTTRQNRGRKTAARFLNIGTDAPPADTAPAKTDTPLSSESEEQTSAIERTHQERVSPTKRRRKSSAQPPPLAQAVEGGARRKSYGGSYDLP
jgi:putative transposase